VAIVAPVIVTIAVWAPPEVAAVEPQPVRLLAAKSVRSTIVGVVIENDLHTDLTSIRHDFLEYLQGIQALQVGVLGVIDRTGLRHCRQCHVRPRNSYRVETISFDGVQHGLIALGIQTLQDGTGGAIRSVPTDRVDPHRIAAGIDDLVAIGVQIPRGKQVAALSGRGQTGGAAYREPSKT
jgi:hypothetical protein